MILDDIVAHTTRRIEGAKQHLPTDILRAKAFEALESDRQSVDRLNGVSYIRSAAFEDSLAQPGISFICEIKRASPSKGLIAHDFPYQQIACEYQSAGADAISVLTEPDFFQGSNDYLYEISQLTQLPILRKDFVIDEYQLFESRVLGASAVLLICSLLTSTQLTLFLMLAEELELAALVEVHSAEEIQKALAAGARIIGVNNRDLTTFQVDLETSARLRPYIPTQVLFVSESGISTPADIQRLAALDVNAVLVGESLMRAADKRLALQALKGVS
ncbi:MAG: indole-3-glycerol phosphate synthase TrpC [Coriobacteriaceae bacterium]|nr:indole-3-glycerol phosphate synthase TrpC [Coriobacteriaceae bacterium]